MQEEKGGTCQDQDEYGHLSVFHDELPSNGRPKDVDTDSLGIAIDCTSGGGGHTAKLLAMGYQKVIAFDRDPQAIAFLSKRFSKEIEIGKLTLVNNGFASIKQACSYYLEDLQIHTIIADLGVSSPQLDEADRGFSFMREGPLDMRMSPNLIPASELIETVELSDLTKIIRDYGEDPKAYQIAKAILREQEKEPITTTLRLAKIVEKAARYKEKSRKHPATKTFQALRIWVNDELGQLETLIKDGFELLSPSGRISIISFHSIEDRIIKKFFKHLSSLPTLPRGLPIIESETPRANLVKPFPLKPEKEEMESNPRARSAKLRTIEKIR